jgi:hypothetical protein
MVLLGIGWADSPAKGQSDAAAPWQARPYQGQSLPPPDCAAPCGSGRCGGTAGCDEGCEADCNERCTVTDCADWLHIFEPCGQFSFRADYLGWWTKSSVLPALVTTSPATTPRSQAGVLGQPDTEILFGGSNADLGVGSGARFGLGYWFTPCRQTGIDVTYLFLGNKAATFDQTSDGSTIFARPFFNTSTALQDSVIIAYPNQQTGVIGVRNATELDTVEVLLRRAVFQDCSRQLDFLFGYRFGRLGESLTIDQSSNYISQVGDIRQGTVIAASDLFGTTNEFNGGEIGFAAKTHYCRWSLELLTKLAVGNTRSRVNIDGSTTVTVPGQTPVTSTGGMLALPTNIGTFQRNEFSMMPELGINFGYDLTCRLKATFGWTFLYWNNVMRPADQIDTQVNSTQFPPGTLRGVPAPLLRPVTTDFWAQGFNVGLDYRY